jgi:hypothetical protein
LRDPVDGRVAVQDRQMQRLRGRKRQAGRREVRRQQPQQGRAQAVRRLRRCQIRQADCASSRRVLSGNRQSVSHRQRCQWHGPGPDETLQPGRSCLPAGGKFLHRLCRRQRDPRAGEGRVHPGADVSRGVCPRRIAAHARVSAVAALRDGASQRRRGRRASSRTLSTSPFSASFSICRS